MPELEQEHVRPLTEEWALERIRSEAIPDFETLAEIERHVRVLKDYAIEPLKIEVRKIIEKHPNSSGGLIPVEERVVSWAEVGRLVAFVDRVREDVANVLDELYELGLHVRDQLPALADGWGIDSDYTADGAATLKRHYGLTNETLSRWGRG